MKGRIGMWRTGLLIVSLFYATSPFANTVTDQSPQTVSTLTQSVGIGDYFQVVLGLVVVVVAIVAMAWMIKRIGIIQTRASGALKLVGGISLSQRERLVVVQVGEQQLLLGVAPGNIAMLHVLAEPIDTANPQTSSPGGFQEKLQAILKGKHT